MDFFWVLYAVSVKAKAATLVSSVTHTSFLKKFTPF